MDTATNPAAINPARLARLKRTSHEESSATAVASTFVHGHAAALIGTFVISWVWFARVVSPLVPYESGSPRAVAQPAAVPEQAWQELHPFVLTCALSAFPGVDLYRPSLWPSEASLPFRRAVR
jgi:hypothetical protein